MNDPSGAGRIAKHSGGVLEEALRGYSWSDKTIELAKDCMTHYGLTPEDYLKYVDMNGLKALSDADAYQYFRVSRVSRDAYLLMEISDEFKISVSQLVADLEKVHGKPIGELDSKTVTSGVRLAQAMMREEKNRQSGDAASNDANDDTDELPFG